MSEHLLVGARDAADPAGRTRWLLLDDATIIDTDLHDRRPAPLSASVTDVGGAHLASGFVDIHCHGGGGTAFDDGPAHAAVALDHHRRHGTTRQLLSLVSGEVDAMAEVMAALAPLVRSTPQALGLHAEGPFLSPGHCGAHVPDLLRDPDADSVRTFLAAADGTLAQITMAPERAGFAEATRMFTAAGVRVAVGHTDGGHDEAEAGFGAGATLLTHAFNGMEPMHHRQPGPVPAAVVDPRVHVEVINDRAHVHPHVLAFLDRAVGERLVLITDAMSATGMPDGNYRLGTLDVAVEAGVARLTSNGSLAGSTLTMDRAVSNAVADGMELWRAIRAATSAPAAALGLGDRHGTLAAGRAADMVLLDDRAGLVAVWAEGVREELGD